MTYRVKEMFYSICGEGRQTGRPAVFVRFAGCNLWSGREEDRAKATCKFCDTDFVGGEKITDDGLIGRIFDLWPIKRKSMPWVVLTGGEPLLQVGNDLMRKMHALRFQIHIETNGTIPIPYPTTFTTVSPKAGASLVVSRAKELKLVYPQPGAEPEVFAGFRANYRYLQPMDGPNLEANTKAAIEYCLAHPQWRLSEQAQKRWGLR